MTTNQTTSLTHTKIQEWIESPQRDQLALARKASSAILSSMSQLGSFKAQQVSEFPAVRPIQTQIIYHIEPQANFFMPKPAPIKDHSDPIFSEWVTDAFSERKSQFSPKDILLFCLSKELHDPYLQRKEVIRKAAESFSDSIQGPNTIRRGVESTMYKINEELKLDESFFILDRLKIVSFLFKTKK